MEERIYILWLCSSQLKTARCLHILVLALLGLGKTLRVKLLVEIQKRKVVLISYIT